MDAAPPQPLTSNNTITDEAPKPPRAPSRTRIIVEFAIIGLVYASEYFILIKTPISWGNAEFVFSNLQAQPPAFTLLTAIFLWINGGFRDLNFSWPAKWKRYLFQLLLLLVIFIIGVEIFAYIIRSLFGISPDTAEIQGHFRQPQLKPFWAFVVLPIWAFAEEFFYRGYVIQRIEQLSRPWQYSTVLAVLLSSALFAINHIQYGVGGLPYYYFSALLYSGIYLYTKRSIWFVAILHYLFNLTFLIG